MRRNMLLQVDEATIDASTAAVLSKLLQRATGPSMTKTKQIYALHDGGGLKEGVDTARETACWCL